MKEIPLDESGRTFLRQFLRDVSGAGALLCDIVSRPGRVFGPLPDCVTPDRAQKFEQGGLQSIDEANQWLANEAQRQLPGYLFFQDPWAGQDDVTQRSKGTLVGDAGVYYYLDSSEASLERISEMRSRLISFQIVVFYVEGTTAFHHPASTHKYFEDILSRICFLGVSAYDQESWVIWERSH